MADRRAEIFDAGASRRSELREYGRSLRKRCPRASHANWSLAADRPDPVALLTAQEDIRDPGLVPIRYGRMLESPFRFFRGSAAVMAADLAATPTTGVYVQACGDAHMHNFGIYASPERNVVFDINDFDETIPAPWEFDVKRLLASIVLECRDSGRDVSTARDALRVTINRYRSVLRALTEYSSLEVHYEILNQRTFFDRDRSEKVADDARRSIRKARKRTRYQAFRKWCTGEGGHMRFRDDPPLLTRLPADEAEQFHESFNQYRETLQPDRAHTLREYRFRDAARRVVGVGSVGLGAYAILLEGRGDHDPLIIQVKEATSSVLAPYVGESVHERHGQRVVHGQRMMQAATDPFLGWTSVVGKEYYLRQMRDMKGKLESPDDTEIFLADVEACGGTLARAHARSLDPALIAGYLGRSDGVIDALESFAFAYADQAERDFETLTDAARTGRIPVERNI